MPGTWNITGEVAFACEISEKRDRAALVAAGRHEGSGKLVVDLSPFYGDPFKVAARISELYVKHDPIAVVIDPRSHAATLLRPLSEAGILALQPSTIEVAVAHGEFLDLVRGGELMHLNQPPLTAAVRAAQQRNLAGAQAWERRLAPEAPDQAPLVAATLACWGFRRSASIEAGLWSF